MSMTDRDREREHRHPGREHLEDRLELIRGAPREQAKEILGLLLDATFGQGYREAVEDLNPRRRTTVAATTASAGSGDG